MVNFYALVLLHVYNANYDKSDIKKEDRQMPVLRRLHTELA